MSPNATARTHDFGRGSRFGGDVVTEIAAKRATKRDKLAADAIPMGQISCHVETIQDHQRDADSVTDDNEYTGKQNSTDQINEIPAAV